MRFPDVYELGSMIPMLSSPQPPAPEGLSWPWPTSSYDMAPPPPAPYSAPRAHGLAGPIYSAVTGAMDGIPQAAYGLEEEARKRRLAASADQQAALDAYGQAQQEPMPERRRIGWRTQDLIGGLLALLAGDQGGDFVKGYLGGKVSARDRMQEADDEQYRRQQEAAARSMQIAMQRAQIAQGDTEIDMQRARDLRQLRDAARLQDREAVQERQRNEAATVGSLDPNNPAASLAKVNMLRRQLGLPDLDGSGFVAGAEQDLKNKPDPASVQNTREQRINIALKALYSPDTDAAAKKVLVSTLRDKLMVPEEEIIAAVGKSYKQLETESRTNERNELLPGKIKKQTAEINVLDQRAQAIIAQIPLTKSQNEMMRLRIAAFPKENQLEIAIMEADLHNKRLGRTGSGDASGMSDIKSLHSLYNSQRTGLIGQIAMETDPSAKAALQNQLKSVESRLAELRKSAEILVGGGGSSPKVPSGDYAALKRFVEGRGWKITSGWATDGHNVGSPHYDGRAVDIRTRDRSESQVAQIIQEAQAAGYRVVDERTRPPGQKVWTGPHLHIEIPRGTPRAIDTNDAKAMLRQVDRERTARYRKPETKAPAKKVPPKGRPATRSGNGFKVEGL